MAKPRRRASGGGRKPQGEFDQLTSPFSMRMPEHLRKQLEAAADKSGRSASQELLARLNSSFSRDRNEDQDRPIRAICFLITELKNNIAVAKSAVEWHRDPFLFRAFKIAVGKLLDELEPSGEMLPPPPTLREHSGESPHPVLQKIADAMDKQRQSPQGVAKNAVWVVVADLSG